MPGNANNSQSVTQIGGDQLTRDRFSGAKRLRATAHEACHRYEHLSPILPDFFHLEMKILQHFFDILYKSTSAADIGTLFASKNRLHRSNISNDVKSNFDGCKDFAISFIDSYVVEAALDFFGMESLMDSPVNHWRLGMDEEQKQHWARDTIGLFVDDFVLTDMKYYLRKPSTPTRRTGINV